MTHKAILTQKQSGVLLSYLNLIAKNIVTLAYTPILLRLLGQSQYGLYQMVNSVIISLTLLDLGFGSAYIRFYAKAQVSDDPDAERKLNGLYLLIFSFLALLSLIIGYLLVVNESRLFGTTLSVSELRTTKILMIMMILNVALTFISSVFDSNIIAHSQFKFQRSRQLFQTIITPILTIPLLLIGFKAISIVLVQTVVTVFFLFLNVRFSMRKLHMRFYFKKLDFSLLREVFVFSFFIFLNQIIDQVNWNLPSFLLGMLSGARDVAIFAVANQIKNIFISLSTTLSGVFAPEINEIVTTSDDNIRLTKIMTKVGMMQSTVLTFILGGFIVLGKFFICVWAGKEYKDAYWLSIILVVPFYVTLVQNTGYEIIRAKNIHQFRAVVEFIFSLANIGITVFAIKKWGLYGSVVGTVLTFVVVSWLIMNWFYQVRAKLNMFYFWRKVGVTLIPGAVSTTYLLIISKLYPIKSIVSFIGLGCIYTVIFVIVLCIIMLTNNWFDDIKKYTNRRGNN
ncbi:oligosaccharide flippase family protein [Lactobacillus sp. DCY120]|uniref:Oligosaccharide flippase family protein n=1 Tax=Bombilactobacillus apium TaxID=2675299 RepID=A0A850R6D8_9LACO|nr:oligosaccharide flippase family protein [Bombilactobacillus apium]NVY96202.1 oligosaccharide flippase family protein [Bombilactobacillus apium]